MSADDASQPTAASEQLDRGVVESLYQEHEAELRRLLRERAAADQVLSSVKALESRSTGVFRAPT